MNQEFDFYKITMPTTRKADFYLGCLDGSVFIDFNRLGNDQISLVRISFDGYGCCNLDERVVLLSNEDSELFIRAIGKEGLDQQAVAEVVKKAIKINRKNIWSDAIEEYGLIEKGQ